MTAFIVFWGYSGPFYLIVGTVLLAIFRPWASNSSRAHSNERIPAPHYISPLQSMGKIRTAIDVSVLNVVGMVVRVLL